MLMQQIEQEYVTNDITYRELSEKYKVSIDKIKRYASKNAWKVKKYQAQEENYTTSQKLKLLSDKVEGIIEMICSDESQFYRHLLKEKNSQQEYGEYIFNKADTKALVDITAAIKNLAAGYRDLEDKEEASGGVIVLAKVDE